MTIPFEPTGDRVLSALCLEPEGEIIRSVYKFPLSIDNLKRLWLKSRHLQNIFSAEVCGDFQKFVELLISGDETSLTPTGLFWVVDDFIGIFYMTRIVPGIDALAHYIFFDKRHKGREVLVKKMMGYAFETFDLNRLSVELPTYASGNAKFFVQHHLGFKREGTRRSAVEYKGFWHDVTLFGLLRSELDVQEIGSAKWEEASTRMLEAALPSE